MAHRRSSEYHQKLGWEFASPQRFGRRAADQRLLAEGSDNQRLTSYNPANGAALATFIDASNADVDAAVNAAQTAFKSWRKTTVVERAAILNKIADIIDENTELFVLQETLDNGKPIRETRAADIPLAADHFRYFAGVIRAEEG